MRNSAYEIIEKKKATYFGIAMAIRRICACIVRDEKSVLPVSTMMQGGYGIEGVALSTPCVLGKNGIEVRLAPSLNYLEQSQLKDSADKMKEIVAELDLDA